MDSSHRANILLTSCIKTPVNPQTKAPAALYERGSAVQQHSQRAEPAGQMDNRDYEEENEYVSDASECEERRGSPLLIKDYVVGAEHLDLHEFYFSNEEYYRKLEELKKAHLQTMSELEKMYRNKLDLKGGEPPEKDCDISKLSSRYQGKKSPMPAKQLLRKSFSANELIHTFGSFVSDMSDEDAAGNCAGHIEKGLLSSPKEHIKSMWDGFLVEDYASHKRLQTCSSVKERQTKNKCEDWNPRITIPKPFNMTIREAEKKKRRVKSRSEIEMENCLLKKQVEELVECQKKFRASPVPAHVYLPLFEEINERNEDRRQFIRDRNRELLLASQKPFSFLERERKKKEMREAQLKDLTPKMEKKAFKAKPIPKSVYDPTVSERIQEEQLYRAIKMQMRAQELLHSSSMPKSMVAQRLVGKKRDSPVEEERELEFHPRINTEIPDFEAKYRKFKKQLMHKKDTKPMTVCEPFHLRTSEITSHKDKILADIEADEIKLKEMRWPYIAPTSPAKARCSSLCSSGSVESLPAKITDTVKKRQDAVRKSLEQRKRAEEEEEKWRAMQRQRERKLQKLVSKRAQANDPHQALAQSSTSRLKQFRKQDQQRRKEYLEEMREIQERVKGRPLLLEQVAQRNAKQAVERRYAEKLKGYGISEAFVSSKAPKVQKHCEGSISGVSFSSEDKESAKDSSRAGSSAGLEEYLDDYEDVEDNTDENNGKNDDNHQGNGEDKGGEKKETRESSIGSDAVDEDDHHSTDKDSDHED
ncbi:protein FAM161A [Amia ocellicauda]|uniref:protein FAM161A n=1 Tax=Amia ocellicauda TaxID=2972642 RepID=UPI003463DD54